MDFYCERAKLVIEVDGAIHRSPDQVEIDAYRREVFAARGLKEVRFTNERVKSDLCGIVEEIKLILAPDA